MRLIKFAPLEIDATRVRVEWTIDPPSPIYQDSSFILDFSGALDPRQLPLRLWWVLVPLIMHSHWNLLRPCRIQLPVTLPKGEAEFWLRMLDQERASLEMYRQTLDFERSIEIAENGPLLEDWAAPETGDRWATAFSGGRDSLAQTALLCEVTKRPLLVNTYSPMPPLIDSESPFRQRALDEIVRRRDVELVVVNSNFRKLWPHYEVPHQLGYPVSMAEMSDPHLVLASTIAVAASRGISHVSLAAELELEPFVSYEDRRCVITPNFAYNTATLLALDRLAQRMGMRVSSLIMPFTQYQLQYLLRTRYADLGDLQISCFWMKDATERSCSRCWKCFRMAVILLSVNDDPATLGIDLSKMFAPGHGLGPSETLQGSTRTLAHAVGTMDRTAVKRYFPRQGVLERLGIIEPRAFTEFNKVANVLATIPAPGIGSTHSRHFGYLPEVIRERIRSISLEMWPTVDNTHPGPDTENINEVADWMTATL
jgi:hypothetical protein